jgi:tetratricopeptide (TPR) repeat protein
LRKLLIVPVVAALVAYAAAALPPPNIARAVTAQRALALREPTAQVWNDLGNLLELAGQPSEAKEAYERALALDAKLVSAHYNLGLLARQGGERDAMKHFQTVVELAPDDAWGWFQIGALREAQGAEGAAVDAYARAFALDPRLSFTDVNPQVIDSKLTTRALLRAQDERPATAEAARAYEDPRRIASLLLPHAPGERATAPVPASPTTAAPAAVAARPPAISVDPTADSKVLRPQDLRAGQVSGGVTTPPPPAPQPGAFNAQPTEPGYSDLLRQQLELQQQQQQDMENTEGQGDPSTGVYVPGVRSSGQISQTLDELQG